jgi:CheY-like chemotaxis protein
MPKILAIDDSPTLRKFISKHLADRFPGAAILLAGNGADGVALAQKESPDVILLDYLLPDCKGEEVCERLAADPATAKIPVILMSSSTPDITRTEGLFPAIKRSMAKPFSPELLCASVNFVLTAPGEEEAAAAEAAEAPPGFSPESAPTVVLTPKLQKVSLAPAPKSSKPVTRPLGQSTPGTVEMPEYCGSLAAFPLWRVVVAPQAAKLTGVLKIEALPTRLELYYHEGLPVLATTRDTALYLKNAPGKVPPEQAEVFEALKKEQESTGEPIFTQMKARELIAAETADAMAREYSSILFANAWLMPQARFLFQHLRALPDFAREAAPLEESAEQFALAALRTLGEEFLGRFAEESAPGTPAYTSSGYHRIQALTLEPEEAALAGQVAAGGQDLGQIASALGMELTAAQLLLARFLALEIFDYWPAPSAA